MKNGDEMRKMKNWPLTFWTPGQAPVDDGQTFGCASHGIAAANLWRGPEESAAAGWPDNGLEGEVVAGTYDAVLARLDQIARKPSAAIVLFSQGGGVETFLERWHERLPGVPVAGGGAALGAGQTCGELLPAAADVAVLLIRGGLWRADTLNAHDCTGRSFEFRADGPRTITHLRERGDWVAAVPAFRALQADYGRAEADCESLTLSEASGRNIHCRFDGVVLHTGADLPADGRFECRTVNRVEVAKRLAAFCAEPDALVFGCAGLRGLLDAPLPVGPGTLAGFMFGELVTLDGRPQFGNLMAVRLVRMPGHNRELLCNP
jgi:hypothetical protein